MEFQATAEGEDVRLLCSARVAESIEHVLRLHARSSLFPTEYRGMADAIAAAIDTAYDNGAPAAPGLRVVVRA